MTLIPRRCCRRRHAVVVVISTGPRLALTRPDSPPPRRQGARPSSPVAAVDDNDGWIKQPGPVAEPPTIEIENLFLFFFDNRPSLEQGKKSGGSPSFGPRFDPVVSRLRPPSWSELGTKLRSVSRQGVRARETDASNFSGCYLFAIRSRCKCSVIYCRSW